MKQKIERYLKILKIELEDLVDDIKDAEEILKTRLEERKITDYVYLENLSFFNAELAGVKKLEKEIDKLQGFESLDDLSKYLNDFIKKRVKEADLPDAVYILIKRKLDKIQKYTS